MLIQTLIKPSRYYDSVSLMMVAKTLTKMAGVQDAAVIMGTEANKGILKEVGLLTPEAGAAGPNDLVIVVKAEHDQGVATALAQAELLLKQKGETSAGAEFQPRTLRTAVRERSNANLVVISVAGQYAVAEAWEALREGLHVLLFSDNVSLEDEVALKRYAREHGLLMMGPDAGTAILNGVALGFANVVPTGPVGIVSASGTGLQEVTTLLAKIGVGISQAIGTGGRDVKASIGGIMMLEALKALQADPATEVLLLISKPPDPEVAQIILAQLQAAAKPAIVCFLGGDLEEISQAGAIPVMTLQEAAYLTGQLLDQSKIPAEGIFEREEKDLIDRSRLLRPSLKPEQKYLRGLFSGGTLAIEALLLWQEEIGGVWSNVALEPQWRLSDPHQSQAHTAIDLGDDLFTIGRPHPMIDQDLRIRRLLREAADPEVAVIMLDVVLGFGAHPDPAGELGPAIRQARAVAAGRGHELIVLGSVTGTEGDPQRLSRQVAALEESGMIVLSSNASAARLAGLLVKSYPS